MKLTNVSNYTVTWFTKHAREVMMLVEGFSCNVLSASQEEHDGWTLDGWKEGMDDIHWRFCRRSIIAPYEQQHDRPSERGRRGGCTVRTTAAAVGQWGRAGGRARAAGMAPAGSALLRKGRRADKWLSSSSSSSSVAWLTNGFASGSSFPSLRPSVPHLLEL